MISTIYIEIEANIIFISFNFIFKFVEYSNISANTFPLMKNASEIELKTTKNHVFMEDF